MGQSLRAQGFEKTRENSRKLEKTRENSRILEFSSRDARYFWSAEHLPGIWVRKCIVVIAQADGWLITAISTAVWRRVINKITSRWLCSDSAGYLIITKWELMLRKIILADYIEIIFNRSDFSQSSPYLFYLYFSRLRLLATLLNALKCKRFSCFLSEVFL